MTIRKTVNEAKRTLTLSGHLGTIAASPLETALKTSLDNVCLAFCICGNSGFLQDGVMD